MFGLVLANKPEGITSGQLVSKLKRIIKEKTGHTGTLDKAACGLMILLLGKATSLSDLFLHQDKKYIATFSLGLSTDSHDREGTIVEDKRAAAPGFLIENKQFIHDWIVACIHLQEQVPPLYSALKKEGRRFSDLARSGMQTLPEKRSIKVYSTGNIQFLNDTDICFEIHVSSGTYIRSFARDLSLALNFPVYMKSLQRISIGEISLFQENIWNAEQDPVIMNPKNFLHLKEIEVPDSETDHIAKGRIIKFDANPDEKFFLIDRSGSCLALCEGIGDTYRYLRVFL